MKRKRASKHLSLLMILALLLTSLMPMGGFAVPAPVTYTETFESWGQTGTSYVTNTFTGDNGFSWTVASGAAMQTAYALDGKGVILKDSNSKITSGTIEGGIARLSVDLRKAFTGAGNRQVEVFVNGTSYGKSMIFGATSSAEDVARTSFAVENINVEGPVVIEIRNAGAKQLSLDNISWTTYSGGGSTVSKVSSVQASKPSSEVAKGTSIELSTPTSGASIYFTTDNSTPTSGSALYVSPIVVNEAMTIKAIGIKEGFDDSSISSFTYTVAAPAPDTVQSISSARAYLDGGTVNQDSGKKALIEGTVVGVLGSGRTVHVQDGTGGIAVRLPAAITGLKVGDTLKATGTVKHYNYLIQLVTATASDAAVTLAEPKTVTPQLITLNDTLENYESQLVTVKGLQVKSISTGTAYNVVMSDSSGKEITVRVESGLVPASHFVVGSVYDVTAPLNQYSTSSATGGYQLMARSAADVVEDTTPDTISPVITHTPVTTTHISSAVTVKATATDNRKIAGLTLSYKVKGAASYKTATMALSSGEFTAVIPSADLAAAGMVYYIEASDGVNTAKMPAGADTVYEIAVDTTDIAGPAITKLIPADGAVLDEADAASGLRAEFSDATGINTATATLSVDGIDVTASATVKADSISYKPDAALTKGTHTAKVVVSDTLGNKTEKTWSFSIGKVDYQFYFGQLHSHTTLSDGQGTVDEAYAWARDKGDADFFAVTDHSNWFDNDLDWTKSTKWQTLKETANKYNQDGSYVALSGYEMTWSGSTGGWGHINTFNTDWFKSRTDKTMDLKTYYDVISKDANSISQLNHPGKTFGDFSDFGFYSKEADAVVNMVEVGNGEGPIRGSGYFPSYEYYTRALDKGWHVAPTNNQDNHKANWVTANEGRTVIVAPSLTREAIYDAMRKMHVYSSEDKNLKVMYKVNEQLMGATLVKPDKLNISISVNDADIDDTVAKISIIADGGTVVTSKSFTDKDVTWNFELPSQYTYYYVRVDQADKDIAVTAPVWTGDVLPVGISKIETSMDPVIAGTPVELSATLYNNGATALAESKVEFFTNNMNAESKIGEAVVNNMLPASMGVGKMTWTPTVAGDYVIYVKMTTTIDGVEKIFTGSMTMKVGALGELTTIILDASHNNYYVSGDYAGKMVNFKALGRERKYMVVENRDKITAEVLADASVLILADPLSVDKAPLTKSLYADDEVAAIKAFVEAGGNLIITSAADYKDPDGEYGSAAQSNKVLEAIGSNLRFNDDQVIDNTNNGGQAYRLYFDQYASPLYSLTNGLDVTDKYSFYSGNSVILKAGGSEAAIDWLVKGHNTTASDDADKKGDNTPVAVGDVRAIAAEQLPGGGKVIASGTTFFSDFETQVGDNAYSNLQLTKNIMDWMTKEKPAVLKTIAEVRADENADGIPDLLGKKFAVEGVITAQSEAVKPKNAFFEVVYVQDATGGLTVFGVSATELPLGTPVRITGTVGQYENDSQLALKDESVQVEVLSGAVTPLAPKQMTTRDSMLEKNEGWLVQVKGVVTRFATQGDNSIFINDGTGEARVYLNGYIGDGSEDMTKLGKWDSRIKVGSIVSAVGLAAEDMGGHRLRVRNTNEIVYLGQTKPDREDSGNSTGSTGGNSGGAAPVNQSPTPTSQTAPNETVKNSDHGVATVVKDPSGKAKVDLVVDTAKLEAQMKTPGSAKLQIDAAVEKGLSQVLVQMKPELFKSAEQANKTLEVRTEGARIAIAPGALKLDSDKAVTLETNTLSGTEQSSLMAKSTNAKTLSALGGVMDLSLKTMSGETAGAVTLAKPLVVTMSFDASKVKDAEKVGVYSLNAKTNKWEFVGAKRGQAGELVFNVTEFSTFAIMESNKTFNDSVDWAKSPIEVLAARQVVSGVSAEQFAPNKAVTNAEFTQMLVNSLRLEKGQKAPAYADVKPGSWYADAVSAAAAYNLIPAEQKSFKPNAELSREAMFAMINKALKASGRTLPEIKATGVSIKEDATRAQAAVVIYKLLKSLDEF